MTAPSSLKDKVREAINAQRTEFTQLAHEVHEHPQLAFEENQAATILAKFLEEKGFAVRRGICGLPTAFVASTGSGPLHVAFCAEYDALPPSCLYDRSKPPELTEVWLVPDRHDLPLRHACGHNLISGASVAAATGLRGVADEAGLTVSVFGTPGEEFIGLPELPAGVRGPGKAVLFEAGAFKGVHAILMVHPFPTPFGVVIPSKAAVRQRASFSHSTLAGHSLGTSELRALEEALRKAALSLRLIPALFVAKTEGEEGSGAQVDFFWLGASLNEANGARDAVRRCFEEAASSAGASVTISDFLPFPEMRHDPVLTAAYRKNAEVLGRIRGRDERIQREIRELFDNPKVPGWVRVVRRLFPSLVTPPGLFMNKFPIEIVYGTDLANASHAIPAIHPFMGIGGEAGAHSVEFTAQADADEAYDAMIDGGVALAWTAVDAATSPALREYLTKKTTKSS